MASIALDTPVAGLHRFGKQLEKQCGRLGIRTVRDLLQYFPSGYEDLREVVAIGDLGQRERAVVRGKVRTIANRRTPRRSMLLTEALIEDGTGTLRCVWFRQPYLAHAFPTGTSVIVAGTLAHDRFGMQCPNPVIERDTDMNLHAGRIVPLYPLTAGITHKQLRFLVHAALPAAQMLRDVLPEHVRTRERLCGITEAIRDVHFPADEHARTRAQDRLAFDEMLQYTVRVRASRRELAEATAVRIPYDAHAVADAKAALPFVLTKGQERAVEEILCDLCGEGTNPRMPTNPQMTEYGIRAIGEHSWIGAPGIVRPMHRLLNGDVGSGKTAIAGVAAAVVARAGFQVAYLAPTDVLAQQQAAVLLRWFAPLGITVACWTATRRAIGGNDVALREVSRAVASGDAQIVVGTHALLGDRVRFARLALAIVDEQHRFGVNQRAALRRKMGTVDGSVPHFHDRENGGHWTGSIPHLLSMTATPIPRTLQLTLLGDLAVSVLDERPALAPRSPKGEVGARAPVRTEVIAPNDRLAMSRAVRAEVSAGRQVFIVCPRIDASTPSSDGAGEENGSAAVTEAFERAQRAFPGVTIGVLHGKLKPAEQGRVMAEFAAGRTLVLVATTVIEVGVDQPNATVMIIEDAERFGLAQLHQLRGRVGRGEHPGTCYLTTRIPAPGILARLRRVAATTDGFALAEMDLAERGPGAVFGTLQSGQPEFRFARMDADCIRRVAAVADELGDVLAQEERAHLE